MSIKRPKRCTLFAVKAPDFQGALKHLSLALDAFLEQIAKVQLVHLPVVVVTEGGLEECDYLVDFPSQLQFILEPLCPHLFWEAVETLDLLPVGACLIQLALAAIQLNNFSVSGEVIGVRFDLLRELLQSELLASLVLRVYIHL